MANDTDLDHVVKLLVSQGCTAERIGLKKDVAVVSDNPDSSVLQLYCMHLVTHSENRPSKKETLLNSIKNKLKDKREEAKDILQALIESKVLILSS